MNSLAERLKKLEQLTQSDEYDTLDPPRRRASKPIQVRITKGFDVETSGGPGGAEPEKPKRENFDLENHLSKKVHEEQALHRKNQLQNMTEHFLEAVSRKTICRQVLFTIEYVELNAVKIAQLMNTVCSSEFKRMLALSLLAQISDLGEKLLTDMIDTLVAVRFPKIHSFIPQPEPEELPDVQKKKSGFFKKK